MGPRALAWEVLCPSLTLLDIASLVMTDAGNLSLKRAYQAADPSKTVFFSTRYLFIHKHQLLLFSIFKAPNPRVPGAVAPRAPWLIRHCT